MRSLTISMAVVTVGLAATWGSLVALEPAPSKAEAHSESARQAGDATIAELATKTEALSTLLAAVKAAGLAETLSGKGPFTVFAPTNEAFAKLPHGVVASLLEPRNRDALIRVLTYHVVAGSADSAAALSQGEFKTVAGPSVQISLSGGQLRVNDARVVLNDIGASNGVVHVIDTVLLPPEPKPSGPNANRIELFALAVERGAPLFNEGSAAACAAIYEVAVTAVLGLSGKMDSSVRAALETALVEIESQRDPAESAWTLRRAMDIAIGVWSRPGSAPASASHSSESAATDSKLVFGFDSTDRNSKWFSVNDDVMGGISKSRMELTSSGTAIFKGALSMENNGGFATIRSPGRNLDIGDYDGFVMRIKGDGRRYGFSALPSDRRFEVNTWRTDFQTRAGVWQEVRVPFDALVQNVMGRRLPQNGPLPPSRIRSIGLSVSDKNEAPFALEIDWIRAYRDESPTSF